LHRFVGSFELSGLTEDSSRQPPPPMRTSRSVKRLSNSGYLRSRAPLRLPNAREANVATGPRSIDVPFAPARSGHRPRQCSSLNQIGHWPALRPRPPDLLGPAPEIPHPPPSQHRGRAGFGNAIVLALYKSRDIWDRARVRRRRMVEFRRSDMGRLFGDCRRWMASCRRHCYHRLRQFDRRRMCRLHGLQIGQVVEQLSAISST
jgi:hypothetical protein